MNFDGAGNGRVTLLDASGRAFAVTGAQDNITGASATNATGGQTGPDLINPNCRGAVLVINITTLTGTTPTLTFTVRGKDPLSGTYYTILASAALAATGQTVLRIYPALTVAANLTASDVLPRTYDVLVTAGGTITAATYTAGVLLIP